MTYASKRSILGAGEVAAAEFVVELEVKVFPPLGGGILCTMASNTVSSPLRNAMMKCLAIFGVIVITAIAVALINSLIGWRVASEVPWWADLIHNIAVTLNGGIIMALILKW